MKPVSQPYDYRHTCTTRTSRLRSGKTRKIHRNHSSRPGQVGSDQPRPGKFLMIGSMLNFTSSSSFFCLLSLISHTTTPGGELFASFDHRQAILFHSLTTFQRRFLALSPRTIDSRFSLTSITADGSATIHMVSSSCTNASSLHR